YTIVTNYQNPNNNNNNSQLLDMNNNTERRNVIRKLLSKIYNIPENQVTSQMIDEVAYFPGGTRYNPNTGHTMASFGVPLENNGMFTYFAYPINQNINPTITETIVTTTIREFEI